VLKLYKILYS